MGTIILWIALTDSLNPVGGSIYATEKSCLENSKSVFYKVSCYQVIIKTDSNKEIK